MVWDLPTRQPVRTLQMPAKGSISAVLVMDRPMFLPGQSAADATLSVLLGTFVKPRISGRTLHEGLNCNLSLPLNMLTLHMSYIAGTAQLGMPCRVQGGQQRLGRDSRAWQQLASGIRQCQQQGSTACAAAGPLSEVHGQLSQ